MASRYDKIKQLCGPENALITDTSGLHARGYFLASSMSRGIVYFDMRSSSVYGLVKRIQPLKIFRNDKANQAKDLNSQT